MNASEVRRARVIAVGRNAIWVVPEGTTEPRLAALRKNDRKRLFAPGDVVLARPLDAERLIVDELEPRGFALVRKTGGGRTKTMAANIDTIAVVAALAEPPPSFTLIDRLVAFAVQHGVAAALLLTKPDLAPPDAARHVAEIYEPLGVTTLVVAPKSGAGIAELRAFLHGRHALLVGQSGVGKSSIFRALGGTAVVGELSRHGRGRQTTTSARLFTLPDGFLIDSPGIGEFTLDPVPPDELPALFVELPAAARDCRFGDCRHLAEPDCAVRAGVEAGRIAPTRYASYQALASGAP
jgi:ribosome biogenesis GTPase